METLGSQSQVGRLYATGASRAIEVLGDVWVLRILRSCFRGTRRFSDYQRLLEVARAVLSERLERMAADGLLVRVGEPGHHHEYRLTERGLDLWGVFVAMWQWERNWGTGAEGTAPLHDRPRSHLVHLACGHAIEPVYACAECKDPVTPFDTFADFEARLPQDQDNAPGLRKRARKVRSDTRASLPTLSRTYGDRWNTALLAAAFQGVKLFSAFEAATGISPGPLSDRLEEMQAMGLFRSRAYAGQRREYRLTRAAIALYPITIELVQWGNRWLWDNRPPMQVRHRPCASLLKAVWLCPHCQVQLTRTSVSFA